MYDYSGAVSGSSPVEAKAQPFGIRVGFTFRRGAYTHGLPTMQAGVASCVVMKVNRQVVLVSLCCSRGSACSPGANDARFRVRHPRPHPTSANASAPNPKVHASA